MGHDFQETSEKCKHFQAFVPLGTGCIKQQQQKIFHGQTEKNCWPGHFRQKPVTPNLVDKQEEKTCKGFYHLIHGNSPFT